MILNKLMPCEPQGCYLSVVEWKGQLWLQAMPMLADGSPSYSDGEVDVELRAFNDEELAEFCAAAAAALDASPAEIKNAIRG